MHGMQPCDALVVAAALARLRLRLHRGAQRRHPHAERREQATPRGAGERGAARKAALACMSRPVGVWLQVGASTGFGAQ